MPATTPRRAAGPPAYTPRVAPEAVRPATLSWLAAALVLATLVTFAGGLANGFVPFDDDQLVYASPDVRLGLSWEGVRWALTGVVLGNWCPATHLSMLASFTLFGLAPWAWHATDLALHTGASLLLLLALARATRDPWRSALVAALFALHPLRVESVAWASERRDVLCAFFWTAAIWAYVREAEQPSRWRRAGVIVAGALALLSKSMAVTLPATLLLLDVWPLCRVPLGGGFGAAWAALRPRLRAQLPLLALAAGVAAVTFAAQSDAGAVQAVDRLPLGIRLQNAVVSLTAYVVRFLWPQDLSFFYPFDARTLTPSRVGGALLAVALAAVVAWRARRRAPAVTVGLLWYAGTLLPVVGLVQVGSQSSADRYTYVPSIGLAVALAWLLPDAVLVSPWRRRLAAAACALWLGALALLSARQVAVWRDGESLFGHALRLDPGNAVAHYQMGRLRIAQGRMAEAAHHLARAAPGMPASADARANLGLALAALGRSAEAEQAFASALRLDPASSGALLGFGRMLVEAGRPAEAIPHLEEAVRRAPLRPAARLILAVARERTGDAEGALAAYRDALAAAPPESPVATAAARGIARGLLAHPGRTRADVEEAVRRAEEIAHSAPPGDTEALGLLADAYTAAGRTAAAAALRERVGGRTGSSEKPVSQP